MRVKKLHSAPFKCEYFIYKIAFLDTLLMLKKLEAGKYNTNH